MTTFQEALKQPASRKLVFVDFQFLKHFFGWLATSPAGAWEQGSDDLVINLNENEVEADEKADLAAVIAATTTTVGAWAYDDGFLYVKPKDGTTIYENFYVATLSLRYDKQGAALDGSPYEPKVITVPKLNLKTSEVFSNKLAQKGAGSVKLDNADAFFSRTDIEPDGIAYVNSQLET